MMSHKELPQEELYKLACEEHQELLPEAIHDVIFEEKELRIS